MKIPVICPFSTNTSIPITKTVPESLSPSISAKSCETTLSITPPESPEAPRFGANESNSSKKIIQGDASRALSNTEKDITIIKLINSHAPSLTFCSDWPTYIFKSSGPLTDKKHRLHSVATAFAIKVLPVPGGPYRRIPEIPV